MYLIILCFFKPLAAYCFYSYNNKLSPASDFKVAVNKMYSEYNDTYDRNNQYSDVDEIIISSNYRGSATSYENNIAIVVVKRAFFLHLSVRPVCLDFDNDLDSTQLAHGNSGKTVYWSDVGNNSNWYFMLNVVDISYMKNEDCNTILSPFNRKYLTKDKFCVRDNNGPFIIDHGGNGLAFLESTTQRYYLRGVRSEYLTTVDDDVFYSFTSIMKHANFIKQHL